METARAHQARERIADRDQLLEEIQDRALWLAMQMIHYANKERRTPDGTKVGGHQASSASVVTILTSLFFDHMRPGDRIAVKPHASPVLHAIHYLLGNLPQAYLKTLREFHGLQAYPSRTKDPDPIDFSTGSVGLGAIAPNYAAITDQYLRAHFPSSHQGSPYRYISVVGDAELDEGSVWETIVEPTARDLPNVLWVVDLNRQSLDRVIPGIRVQLWRQLFSASGWCVIDAKYGRKLQSAFAAPRGELLRECIDEMPNEAYQRLLRLPPEAIREILPSFSRFPDDFRQLVSQWNDAELRALLMDLGGHDFATLRDAFSEASKAHQASVVFAYTHKGWRLPMVGDPQNHSVVLSPRDMDDLRGNLKVGEHEIWSGFSDDCAAGRLCIETGERLRSRSIVKAEPLSLNLPASIGHTYGGNMSTQQAFGLILTDIARELPDLAERIVTVSPDVATSTNLGGWINKVGVWAKSEERFLPDDGVHRSLNWRQRLNGRHIELGISENSLFMLLGQLGLSFELSGELLFPIGTLYDPFVCRGLEAFMYGTYSASRFMVVGTPSGITLSPEGGAHQSLITPSIGLEIPDLVFYEPCFAQELEWIVLAGLDNIRKRMESTYLRLTTKPVDQSLLAVPEDPADRERLRHQVLDGAYRVVDQSADAEYLPGDNVVHVFVSGALVPEAIEASRLLKDEGVLANVINVTSADRLFRRFQECSSRAMKGQTDSNTFLADVLSPPERAVPVVTVMDGHPHTLAWIGAALGTNALPLGVSRFGQSGSRQDLYREYEIDVASIMAAAFGALEGHRK